MSSSEYAKSVDVFYFVLELTPSSSTVITKIINHFYRPATIINLKFSHHVPQPAKRLNSASKSRRRLLSRESRTPDLVKPEVADLQGNTISIRLEEGEEGPEEEEDGDLTPKVCQLDSVREVDECWSSISWSSLYDRGTDSSLSWADDVNIWRPNSSRELKYFSFSGV